MNGDQDTIPEALGEEAQSGNAIKAWINTAPIAPVIAGLGIILTMILWWGLRSIENEQAQVDQDRLFLAQSTQLEGDITEAAELLTQISVGLGNNDRPTNKELAAKSEQIGGLPIAYAHFVRSIDEAVELVEVERRRGAEEFALQFDENKAPYPGNVLVLTNVIGATEGRGFAGANIADSSVIDEVLAEQQTDERTVVGLNESLQVFGESETGIMLAAGVTETGNTQGELVGVLLGWLDAQALLDGIEHDAGSIQITANDVVLQSTEQTSGKPFGEPTNFSSAGVEWSVQGFKPSIDASHWLSWLAMLAGFVLTGAAAAFARSVRNHAVTLGRLERSQFDASHDDLTGLLNRAGITHEVNKLVSLRTGKEMIGLLFCDLDRLKVVNDSIGHSAGDEVLIEVADRLKRVVRPNDVIGRFGGDEFVIATLGLPSIGDLERLAARMLDALKEPVILSDGSAQIASASIGIAVSNDAESSSESLLRDADSAMYKAKDAGGAGFVVFDSELRAQAVARLEVERELRRAIRKGQLVVHYQPIVHLEDGSVRKVEALVRWQHPERGLIPPGQFLSVAAESGLIVELGEHVLRVAASQAASWSKTLGRPLAMSVNVAERQLLDNSLIDTVRKVLAETGLAPEQLELEISEELIVERLDGRLGMLRDLADMGVRLAIDDFGTSRASLSQLKLLDMVHTLKVDRAFVNEVATDEVDRHIVTAIVALAKSVNMEIVAEGVEDADQAAVLNDLGVDEIQGFYFSRPASHDQVIDVLPTKFDLPWETNANS